MRKGNALIFFLLVIGFAVFIFLVSVGTFKKVGIDKIDFSFFKNVVRNIRLTSTYGGGGGSGRKSQTGGGAYNSPSKISSPEATSTINPQYIPKGFTAEQISLYFHKVRLSSVSAGSTYYYGTVVLTTSLKEKEALDVTGWQIKGRSGGQFVPQAIEIFEPLGLAQDWDIILRQNDYVGIYTSRSANGRNFRMNKCVGYLENTTHFTPSLPRYCPPPNRSEIENFSSRCYDYILSLDSCAVPRGNVALPNNDFACRDYLNTINYKGCFDRHRGDKDFLSHEWRVWSGSRFLDERHDKVLLLDSKGLLVDLYSY
ncbi:MAG: hypothetical protein HY093_00155 [Candidatus Liptonbacteria bacterium]|nr:hypothetical protein [Candidatus Liptonbacteria bacterium]